MHHQPQPGGAQPVQALQQPVYAGQVRLQAGLHQLMGHPEGRCAGFIAVREGTITLAPAGEFRLVPGMLGQLGRARQKLMHGNRLRHLVKFG
ncbi:hypothetical protein D3C77_600010 [compost metagenome]